MGRGAYQAGVSVQLAQLETVSISDMPVTILYPRMVTEKIANFEGRLYPSSESVISGFCNQRLEGGGWMENRSWIEKMLLF